MSGDYTRSTFKQDKHFSGVRHQQGRVLLDADWNEAVDIGHHGERTALTDVIGPAGMPEDAAGFELTPVSAGSTHDLVIGTGRAYVEGLLVEHLEADPTTIQKESGSGTSTVWIVTSGPTLQAGQWVRRQADSLPTATTVAALVASAVEDDDRQRVKFSTDIGGTSHTIVGLATYGTQAHEPTAPADLAAGPYFAYLDVWEREITSLDDDALEDAALGGVDTTLRTQVTWKVDLLALKPLIDAGTIPSPPSCKAFPDGWSPLGTGTRVTLAARTNPVEETPDPCALPSEGGYRSLDNRLYRVEVHGLITKSGTTKTYIKWSRDNGIHRSRLLAVKDGSLEVDSVGRDSVTAFTSSEWVEVIDERRILAGEPGFFVELGEIVDTRLGITTILDPLTLEPVLDGTEPDTDVLPAEGFVRRWEGGQPVAAAAATWVPLENGIEVQVASGAAQSGDYWLIPARTTTAAIEWPEDDATDDAAFEPPHGVAHHVCALGIVERAAGGAWTVLDDCRDLFPPLTELESFFYLGGDGQEAKSDLKGAAATTVALDSPLSVGVARGETPVEGRLVRFTVTDAAPRATLAPSATTAAGDVVSSSGTVLILKTNASGIARAALSLDSRRHSNHVTAELLDGVQPAHASPIHLPIAFTARTSEASKVAYDPDSCPYQNAAAITPGITGDVQAAIDKLCPRVELLMLGGDGQELCVGQNAPAPLAVGIFWGKQPLQGVSVSFQVTEGNATVVSSPAMTNAGGIATVTLKAGSDALANSGVVKVTATPGLTPSATPSALTFTARFVNAACVYVGPEVCPDGQKATGSNTVAALLTHLCETQGEDKGIHVTGIQWFDDKAKAVAAKYDDVIDAATLSRGVVFEVDAALDPLAVAAAVSKVPSAPVGEVELDLVFPEQGLESEWWNDTVPKPSWFATRPTRLDGSFELVSDRKGRERFALQWVPTKGAQSWLTTAFEKVMQRRRVEVVEARLVLRGNRIWSEKDRLFLDGDLFRDPEKPAVALFPSGDGRRGGDLTLPFFLAVKAAASKTVNLHPLTDSLFFKGLSASAAGKVGTGVDFALNRASYAAGNVVPESVVFDGARKADPARARTNITSAAVTDRQLRILIPNRYKQLGAAMVQDIASAGLMTRGVDVADDGVVEKIKRTDPAVDAVLADDEILSAIKADQGASARVGSSIVKL
jgi:hypothetical protein